MQAFCNGRFRNFIYRIPGKMPNWLSYSGEGCSLSFHIPPVFQGLVVWFACPLEKYVHDNTITIRNKSNGIQLFEDKRTVTAGWIRYISRSEMAMEDYCADDELELYIYSSEPTEIAVIAGKSEVGRDTVMSSPPPYHLLPQPHCGSVTASTPKQWSDYLFSKLQNHNLNLWLYGKNKYFL